MSVLQTAKTKAVRRSAISHKSNASLYRKSSSNIRYSNLYKTTQHWNECNKSNLKGTVNYLAEMNEKGKISQAVFAGIVVAVCAALIENEVSGRVTRVVEKRLNEFF